ncbi:MAG: AAA family ATPase, partial [Pseudomonadota bacterium]
YPDKASVFDLYVSPVETGSAGGGGGGVVEEGAGAGGARSGGAFQYWQDAVPAFNPVGEVPFASIVVPTVDLARLSFLADLLVRRGRPMLLVGGAGTGKTVIVQEYLRNLDDGFATAVVNMNYYTDSRSLQAQLEEPIEKRSGRIYGPPASKKLVFFIDDLNMPFVETYGTQTPI